MGSEYGIWDGERHLKDEADVKRVIVYCGYCGHKMQEVLHPDPIFDRTTGKQGRVGSLYWECPKRGVGVSAELYGDWIVQGYEQNPHDSQFLRTVTKSQVEASAMSRRE